MFEHLCSITNPKELITYCKKHMKEAIINPVGCRVFTNEDIKVFYCVLWWVGGV